MKLVGLLPCRNEAWVLGLSLRVALLWCDEVVVLLHACTDASQQIVTQIAAEFPDRVHWMVTSDSRWDEMSHRQDMLDAARAFDNPTHIALIDADEILTGNFLYRVRGWCEQLNGSQRLELPLYNLRGGITRYHANGTWGNRWTTVAFKDDPRLHWGGDTFHHREPFGMHLSPWRPVQHAAGGVLHLWGASERRLKAKQALYKITERIRWPHKPVQQINDYYNLSVYDAGRAPAWTFKDVPESWWASYDIGLLDVDAEPWQEAEARQLVAEHGAQRLDGLDLFGVV